MTHGGRQLEHREFGSIPRDEKSGVEESRPRAAVCLRRGKQRAQEEFDVARWTAPARHMQLIIARVPPLVPRAGRPDHELARTGELRLAAEYLIPKPSADHACRLFLKVVHMHRWTGSGLSDAVGSRTLPFRSPRHSRKRETLAVSVVDCVRVGPVSHVAERA
jgi:hypothetical protein